MVFDLAADVATAVQAKENSNMKSFAFSSWSFYIFVPGTLEDEVFVYIRANFDSSEGTRFRDGFAPDSPRRGVNCEY